MTAIVPRPDDGRPGAVPVTCPMCHTISPLPEGDAIAGGDWQCARCGQRWDTARLATVAAYAAWLARLR